MKICKIKFENIHALKGVHTIDFENGILGEAGLFVITGATGTGKSTLLDVITLALYNKIPRIDKAITESVIENEGVILTKNASDCYAEVIYEVKGVKYLSSWSIRRTRTGTLDKRKQELVNLDTGKILVSTVQEVVSENERIIGLNYNQFVQSMILAQGQFSKLLLAKKDDRNALLEEITGSSIYRKIGRAVFYRYKGTDEAVKTQKIKMGETVLLDPELVKEIQVDIDTRKPLLKLKEVEHDTLSKKKILKESILKNLKLQQNNAVDWLDFLKRKEAFLPQEKQLAVHNELVVFKDQMLTLMQTQKTIVAVEEQIASSNSKIADQITVKNNLVVLANELLKREIDPLQFEEEVNNFRSQVLVLEQKEKDCYTKAQQESQRIQDRNAELKSYGISLTINETLEEQLSKELSRIDAYIQQKAISSIDAVRNEKDILTKRIITANALVGDKKLFDERRKGIVDLKAKLESQEKEIIALATQQKEQQSFIETLVPKVEKAKEEFESWQQRKSLDEHRHDLKDGQPCPLCGSEKHPFVEEASQILVKTLEENYKELASKLEVFQKAMLENKFKTQNLIESTDKEQQSLKFKLVDFHTLELKIVEGCSRLSWKATDDLLAWEQNATIFTRTLAELDQLENFIKAKKVLENLNNLFVEYLVYKRDYSLAKAELAKVYYRKDITAEVSKLSNGYSSCNSTLKNLQEQLAVYNKSLKLAVEERAHTQSILLPQLLERGITTVEELRTKIVDENVAAQLRANLQGLTEQEIKLKSNKDAIEKALNEEQKLDDTSATLDELIAELNKISVEIEATKKHIWEQDNKIILNELNKEKLKESQVMLDALQKESALWGQMNALIGDANGKKFSNFVQDLTLKQLLEYGNQRLIGFSDRYLLDSSSDYDGLRVIDTYMGNTKRSVSSLSGGETFKLSLALAFGLSDLAARNVSIESLFIDEGFGSLDPESLDQAISILENMQHESNKSIGIISHVGELKDRIGSKIKLVRTAAGYSTIEIE